MPRLIVVKLARESGRELWRFPAPESEPLFGHGVDVSVDADGNPIVIGYWHSAGNLLVSATIVLKLDGTTGQEIWRTAITGSRRHGTNRGFRVIEASGGRIVGAGIASDTHGGRDLTVFALDGGSGAVTWCRRVDGLARERFINDLAFDVAPDLMGNV